MALLENLVAAIAGAIATVIGWQVVRRWRSPEIKMALYGRSKEEARIITRESIIKEPNHDNEEIRQTNFEMYLEVWNNGNTPADDCRVIMDVLGPNEESLATQTLQYQQVLTEGEPSPNNHDDHKSEAIKLQINRGERIVLPLLRLQFQTVWETFLEKEVDLKNVTLETIGGSDIFVLEPDVHYTLKIELTAANVDRVTTTIEVDWNGGHEQSDLRKSVGI